MVLFSESHQEGTQPIFEISAVLSRIHSRVIDKVADTKGASA
ncbi:MAG: hypothetical protein ABF679_00160 [Lentilactobacillus diolivorans]